ncbi:hypothetical protein H8D30_06885 [bacterium]|nr:hypothetical protein [bacterium]
MIRLGSRSEVVWGGEAQYLLPWPPPSPVGTTPPTQRGIKRDVTRRVQGEEGVIALLSSASTFVHPLLVSATLVDRFVDGDTDALTWRLVIRGDESLEEGEIRTVVEAFEASL